MAKRKKALMMWWKALFLVIASGAGFAAIIGFKWDLFMHELGALDPQEYSQKDLLQCEPGTHQQNGMCASNPDSAVPQRKAVASPKAPSK